MRLSRLRVYGLTVKLSFPAIRSKSSFWMTLVASLLGRSVVREVGCRRREVDIRECKGSRPSYLPRSGGVVAVGGMRGAVTSEMESETLVVEEGSRPRGSVTGHSVPMVKQ